MEPPLSQLLMTNSQITTELRQQIIDQIRAGQSPENVLRPLLEDGWEQQQAIDAIELVTREFLAEHARANALPTPTRVPAPIGLNGPSVVWAGDREVQILASLLLPRIVVLGSVLSGEECAELIAIARERVARSSVVNTHTGADQVHEARTSEGVYFDRGATALCRCIETRLAVVLDWPVENGEGLQVLRYGVGAEYKPHYDYFDPQQPGMRSILQRGGQRVASVVMYLNTPSSGGATTFPDAKFEVGAIQGNAVFFSYDRPHPMTRSLHGGAPVTSGEKWVATKWLRERPYTS
jgi:prolyl 4-hydroxylase